MGSIGVRRPRMTILLDVEERGVGRMLRCRMHLRRNGNDETLPNVRRLEERPSYSERRKRRRPSG